MNDKLMCKVLVMIVILLSLTVMSFSYELNIIAKVRENVIDNQQSISIKSTGNVSWDELNLKYCCTELKMLTRGLKDNKRNKELGLNRIYTMKLSCIDDDTSSIINNYMQTNCFEFVEVNAVLNSITAMLNEPFFPDDPFWLCQWPLHNDGIDIVDTVKVDVDIDMPEAWGIELGDTSIIIAILDGGINNLNNEFDGRLWTNKNEIPDNGIDDDGNGYIDDVNGWNFVDNNNILGEIVRGHGTAVTSIIGSNTNNGQGLAGVNGKSKLMILKVSDTTGKSYIDRTVSAIQYAVNNNAKILNLSTASPNYSQVTEIYTNLAYSHNVTICAGSGNNNVDSVYYPAKLPHVIAVGATTRNDKRCTSWMGNSLNSGSNYGDSLDVVAPGDSITILYYKTGGYVRNGGTSLSTAFVTGLASLLISQDTSRTPDEIYKLITSTADDQVGDPAEDTPGYDKYYGYGRINAYKALLAGESTLLDKKRKKTYKNMHVSSVEFVKNCNKLHIKLTDNKNQELSAKFKLFTPSGKIIYSVNQKTASNELSINLPHLSRGIYCYSIDLNENSHSGKLLY